MKYDAIIIGAGMSGLAAGIRLAHYNKKVCIVEKHAIPGGLNSHYTKDGRRFDVGLHAMTNFVPKGVNKQAPLSKLLRQLRIPYDALDLCEQSYSAIDFGDVRLRFGNSFSYLREEIADKFPDQIDGFLQLVEKIEGHHDVSLDAVYLSSRQVVGSFISNPRLADMIFCPLMYYGSAVEDDMDFSQFCIMFKSIFLEGFCRPQIGVRHLLRLLTKDYKAKGGELRLRKGVRQIVLSKDGSKAQGVELEDGTVLEADKILSSAGLCETSALLGDIPEKKYEPGQLSFVESMLILDKMPADLGVEETIIFYNRGDSFEYRCPKGRPADPRSGVICFPNNFQYRDQEPTEGMVRFTSLADYQVWKNYSPEQYAAQKDIFIKAQLEATGFADAFSDHIVYKDAFTPTTVKKFTSHFNGAIYGAPHKVKDGRLSVDNIFLCGTDQGFLGIVGALLSGISMANLHMMK